LQNCPFFKAALSNAMMFEGAELIEPRTPASMKGIRPVKKHLSLLAAILAIASAPICSAAQQSPAQPAARRQSVAPEPRQPVFSVNASAERLLNLDLYKKELRQYHDCTCKCGCYFQDIDIQADRAIAFLRRRAAHRNPKEELAMVLDIDETSLSNYQELLGADFTFNRPVFDAWVDSGQSPVIPGTLRLYKEAQRLGVSVFFITGRPERQLAITEENLRAQGFQDWQQLTLRPPSAAKQPVGAFKADVRAQIVAQGYKIVLNVGDQWSDLKGNPEAEFSVKYPDPFYYLP
jgi:hypothetical protein